MVINVVDIEKKVHVAVYSKVLEMEYSKTITK